MGASGDTALVSAALAGDEHAYGSLFEEYESRIYNYAYGIAGNPDDARDITQDAFLKVFEALPRLTQDVNFSAYLYRTTHNLAVDAVKVRSRFAPPDALDLESETSLPIDPERMALLREQQTVVREAAFGLPENQRAVLALRELHEMSYQEIADVLEMPRNTVGVVLSRARLKFKEVFRMSTVDAHDLAKECEDMFPLLSGYIDDELDDEERTRVGSHVEECAFCALALEDMREASQSYRGIIPLLPPASIEDGVLSGLYEFLDAEEAAAAPAETTVPGPADTAVLDAAPDPARAGRTRARKVAVVASIAIVLVLLSAGGFWALGPGSERTSEPFVLRLDEKAESTGVGDALVASPESSPLATTTAEKIPTYGTPREEGELDSEEDLTATEDPVQAGVGPDTPQQLKPGNGVTLDGSSLMMRWTSVDGDGITYAVEIQSRTGEGSSYSSAGTVFGLTGTQHERTMSGTSERWRVWAIDWNGNTSTKSSWWTYSRTGGEDPYAETPDPPY